MSTDLLILVIVLAVFLVGAVIILWPHDNMGFERDVTPHHNGQKRHFSD